jgi:cytidylate kinase
LNLTSMSSASRGVNMAKSGPFIVAVDGPAGSGKSSICHKVAEKIGWNYINTGALYRAVGLLAIRSKVDLEDEVRLANLVDEVAPHIAWNHKTKELLYKNDNLTAYLQSEETGYAASKIARSGIVRERLLPVQRQMTMTSEKGALVDGRDIGTVVFPEADLKVFLTASLEERSRRRLSQLGSQEVSNIEEIKEGLARRDQRDEHRDVAPLKQAADALVLDTSNINFDETVDTLIKMIKERGLI